MDTDSTFWSRIKLLSSFVFTGAQKSGEVEAAGNTAKIYRVGNIVRCDITFKPGERKEERDRNAND